MAKISARNPKSLPRPHTRVVIEIPDGQARIPMLVNSVNEYFDEDGEGGIWEVHGTVLSAGRYGFGSEARSYRAGANIVVAVTSGDMWAPLKSL